VKKNGTHGVDNQDPLKRIQRITKGGEAARLFIRTLDGGLERMAEPESLPAGVSLLAARTTDGAARVLVANTGEARRLRLDFSGWNLAPGSVWAAEEVSEQAHGAITQWGRVSPDRAVELHLPAESNVGLRVELTGAETVVSDVPVHDGRWSLAPLPAGTRWLGFRPAAVDSPRRIVRAWLETEDGQLLRLLGHLVIGGAVDEQWLEVRAEEIRAGAWVRIEPNSPEEPPIAGETVALRSRR
jgi:hypothetical protein